MPELKGFHALAADCRRGGESQLGCQSPSGKRASYPDLERWTRIIRRPRARCQRGARGGRCDSLPLSLPFDRARGLAGHVIDDTVDALDLADDALGHAAEEI